MTRYRDRLNAGEYTTEKESAKQPTTPAETPTEETRTLAELQTEAAELGLPTYGTKAQLAQRITDTQ